MKNFEDTLDEDLTELYKKKASELSYYNAAEGPSWYAEEVARSACSAEFRKVREEMKRRGIDLPQGNYLV